MDELNLTKEQQTLRLYIFPKSPKALQTEIGKVTEDRKKRESITDKMFLKSCSHTGLAVSAYLSFLTTPTALVITY